MEKYMAGFILMLVLLSALAYAGAEDTGDTARVRFAEPACLKACGLHKESDTYTEIQTDRQGFVICSKQVDDINAAIKSEIARAIQNAHDDTPVTFDLYTGADK